MAMSSDQRLQALGQLWMGKWPEALEAWSKFTKLTPPRLVTTPGEEKAERLSGSFAMIRLEDHAVVISLRQVEELGLQSFAAQILAHEIGHHVYAPADLRDNALLIARIKAALPTEGHEGFVANLYTDLLINNRLQVSRSLDMAGVYKKLRREDDAGKVWGLYMRIYEYLWDLPEGTLTPPIKDKKILVDAQLGARVIKAYSKDWLDGAGRFAALLAPYMEERGFKKSMAVFGPILDADKAGGGGVIPDGLAEIDPGEAEGAIHPADDPDLSGFGDMDDGPEGGEKSSAPAAGGRAEIGGRKNNYRSPAEYTSLMKSAAAGVKEDELVVRYYRERALPHLISFPERESPQASDPLPEGLEIWDMGQPFGELDWVETMVKSPVVIPGITTYQRTYGYSEGSSPDRRPPDLYVGIDCSGSMVNPKHALSYPALAGAIVAISALRAGARVMACLSGEPGKYKETDGFLRDEKEVLKLLTGYLGTGYAYGIRRLQDTFLGAGGVKTPAHIIVITDQDIFMMIKEAPNGWDVAFDALKAARGGGTFVLNITNPSYYSREINKLEEAGWSVYLVNNQEQMLEFARKFSQRTYSVETDGS